VGLLVVVVWQPLKTKKTSNQQKIKRGNQGRHEGLFQDELCAVIDHRDNLTVFCFGESHRELTTGIDMRAAKTGMTGFRRGGREDAN